MSFGRFVGGSVLLVIVCGSLCLSAVLLRSVVLPGASGVVARLAEAVVGISLLVVLAEALGTVGLFTRLALVVGCVATAAAVAYGTRRAGGAGRVDRAEGVARAGARSIGPVCCWVVGLGVAALVGEWAQRTLAAFHLGMGDVDTVWYHLPYAVQFVQHRSTTHLYYFDAQFLTAFYPANAELVQGTGLLLYGRDAITPLINMGWLAVALLAGWCVGVRRGVGPLTLAAACVVLALPVLVSTQAGTGENDVAGLAMLLAGVALLIDRQGRSGLGGRTLLLAGAAVGLAAGTRLTVLIPAGALTVLVAALSWRSGDRWQRIGAWCAGLLLTGGYWYVRNLMRTGSPVPFLHIDVGPFHLPSAATPLEGATEWTVAHYLGASGVWRHFFLPGLHTGFGLAWPVVLVLVAAGALLSLGSPSGLLRGLGLVTAIGLAGYALTPATAAGHAGHPLGFEDNLRYVTPDLLLGLSLLALAPVMTVTGRRRAAWLAVLIATVAVMQTGSGVWLPEYRRTGIAIACLVAVAPQLTFIVRRWAIMRTPLMSWAVGLAATAFAFGVLWPLSRDYVARAYTTTRDPYTPWAVYGLQPVLTWARGISGRRIAVGGTLGGYFQYPLYGADLSNRIQYIGRQGPHGSFTPIGSCGQWRHALAAGAYRYVVTLPDVDPWNPYHPWRSRESQWTATDPDAKVVVRATHLASVYEISGYTSAGCK